MATPTTLDVSPNTFEMASGETAPLTFDMSNLLAGSETVLSSPLPTAKMVSQSNGVTASTPACTVSGNLVACNVIGSVLSVGTNYRLLITFQTSTGKILTTNLNINVIF